MDASSVNSRIAFSKEADGKPRDFPRLSITPVVVLAFRECPHSNADGGELGTLHHRDA